MWVLDFGIQAYEENYYREEISPPSLIAQNQFIEDLGLGEFVEGTILLSVDHYSYMEMFCGKEKVPPLIYTWRIDRINQNSAPQHVEEGRVHFDRTQETWISVDCTHTRVKQFTGSSELVCAQLYSKPSSDGLPLARWDGSEAGSFEGSQLDARGKSDEEVAKVIAGADLHLYLAESYLIDLGVNSTGSALSKSYLSRKQLETFLEHETCKELLSVCASESCFYGGETRAYLETLGFESLFAVRMDPKAAYDLRRKEKLFSEHHQSIRWRVVKCNWESTQFDIGIGSGSGWSKNLGEKFESPFPDRYLLSKEQLMAFLLQDSQRDGLLVVLPAGMDHDSHPFEFLSVETNYHKVVFVEKGNFNISDFV
jgi:hypothetical protein